ncbi:MAG: GGDEF domain-containing protein [Acidobacteria bacterium]|nr:GGDEF domain-containing protein [Acidobacteriota bacterium]
MPEKHTLPSGFEFCRELDAPGTDGAFDFVVMDMQAFPDLDRLRQKYVSLGLPTLLIIDTVEQETFALTWLAPEDEVCRRDVLVQQLALRLSRRQRRDEAPAPMTDKSLGVATRREFEAYANAQIAGNEAGDPQCLVWLDIGSFKIINHELGHAAGDQILQEVAQLLIRCAAGTGFVARFGGDEFVILMQCSLEQGAAFAGFLKEQISLNGFRIGSRTVHVTASFGVASSLQLSAVSFFAKSKKVMDKNFISGGILAPKNAEVQ